MGPIRPTSPPPGALPRATPPTTRTTGVNAHDGRPARTQRGGPARRRTSGALGGFFGKFPDRLALRVRLDDVAERNLPVTQGVYDDLHASTDTQAPLGSFDVVVRRALADSQQRADRPVVLALPRQFQALPLPHAELQRARSAALLECDTTKHGIEHEAGHREQGLVGAPLEDR